MENLAPPLKLLLFVRFTLEKGEGLKSALVPWFEAQGADAFLMDARLLLVKMNLGQDFSSLVQKQKSPYRRACLQVLAQGLKGESIYQHVCALEEETLEACRHEVEAFQLTLPIKSMIPLVLFQFPAFLLIVLGPLLLYINQM